VCYFMRYRVIHFQCYCYLALPLCTVCIVIIHLVYIWHVVFFDTSCVFLFPLFFLLISCFWSCNFMRIKMYIKLNRRHEHKVTHSSSGQQIRREDTEHTLWVKQFYPPPALRFSGTISSITENSNKIFYTLIVCSYLFKVTKLYSVTSRA